MSLEMVSSRAGQVARSILPGLLCFTQTKGRLREGVTGLHPTPPGPAWVFLAGLSSAGTGSGGFPASAPVASLRTPCLGRGSAHNPGVRVEASERRAGQAGSSIRNQEQSRFLLQSRSTAGNKHARTGFQIQ